jgi:hypothetical protein
MKTSHLLVIGGLALLLASCSSSPRNLIVGRRQTLKFKRAK